MNASPPYPATGGNYRRALRQALNLALGTARGVTDVDWMLAFEIAEAERIAALSWHRSGEVVRAEAPAAVVDRWRAHAMRVELQAETLIGTVADAIAALGSAGVRAVVFKGPPL